MKATETTTVPWRSGLLVGTIAVAILVWTFFTVPLDQLVRPWYLNRASGLVALSVLWLSAVMGLMQSSGLLKGRVRPGANIDVHGFTSVLGLCLTLFHGLILIFDQHTPFTVSEVLFPFVSTYKPGETALGIIAFYIFFIAVATTYMRLRFTPIVWRVLHLLSLVGFVTALVHGLQVGSDSELPVVYYMYQLMAVSVAALTIYRFALALRPAKLMRHDQSLQRSQGNA